MTTKTFALLFFLAFAIQIAFGQKYMTKNGHIRFYSETPIETIEAHNRQVNSALDLTSGDFVFRVLMKSFEFEKALMQEHFNENYVESDKFPNAIFNGKVLNIESLDLTSTETFEAEIEGDLTIHGVTRKIKEKGVFTTDGQAITGHSTFIVKPADYDIKIPKAVVNNIAQEIEVTVNVVLESL
ncbi:MAG: YceI family protein [Bacteroidales bacterium]